MVYEYGLGVHQHDPVPGSDSRPRNRHMLRKYRPDHGLGRRLRRTARCAAGVNANEVVRVLNENDERVRDVILDMIKKMSLGPCDECAQAMAFARLG